MRSSPSAIPITTSSPRSWAGPRARRARGTAGSSIRSTARRTSRTACRCSAARWRSKWTDGSRSAPCTTRRATSCSRPSAASGAYLNGTRLHVSQTETLIDALLVTGFPYAVQEKMTELVGLFAAFLGEARAVRRLGIGRARHLLRRRRADGRVLGTGPQRLGHRRRRAARRGSRRARDRARRGPLRATLGPHSSPPTGPSTTRWCASSRGSTTKPALARTEHVAVRLSDVGRMPVRRSQPVHKRGRSPDRCRRSDGPNAAIPDVFRSHSVGIARALLSARTARWHGRASLRRTSYVASHLDRNGAAGVAGGRGAGAGTGPGIQRLVRLLLAARRGQPRERRRAQRRSLHRHGVSVRAAAVRGRRLRRVLVRRRVPDRHRQVHRSGRGRRLLPADRAQRSTSSSPVPTTPRSSRT